MDATRLPAPRTLVWAVSFATAALLCLAWSLLPSLEAQPFARVAAFAATGLCMVGLVFSFPRLSDPKSRLLIIGGALLLRLILLPAPFSDDVHRYIWEGQLVASGENPYAVPADDELWTEYRDHHWERMNHRDRPTAYPPGALWLMSKVATIGDPVLGFKLLALAGDLTTLGLLLLFLRMEVLPIRWAGFYAFNPVVLIGFAAEAHFDSLMVAAIIGSLLAATCRRHALAVILLALAVQLKFIAVLLLPFLLISPGFHWKGSHKDLGFMARNAGLFLIALILIALPFRSAILPWIQGLSHFANTSAFNGPLFTFLSLGGLAPEIVRTLCYATFALAFAAVLIARLRGLGLIDCYHAGLTLLLLCSPIVHFWYLAWLVPLTALRPSFGWTAASITMGGYFLAWHTLAARGWWGYGHLTAAFIWTPAVIAFAAQHRQLIARIRFNLKSATKIDGGNRLGIVIPTLNPGPELQPLIQRIAKETDAPIVIADASDHLPNVSSARVIKAPKGRGDQIAAGADALDSDWILIAHADATPPAGWHDDLAVAIRRHPKTAMFVFGQRFDLTRTPTLLIEILNELRVVFGGVAFGDQTMVVRRSALDSSGGFPAQPLMEDVEVSLRLHTRGRIVYLGKEWTVSAAKWRNAFSPRFRAVIRFVAAYQFARLKGPEHAAARARSLYREYYS